MILEPPEGHIGLRSDDFLWFANYLNLIGNFCCGLGKVFAFRG
jgi:hypothetical protein